MSPIQCVIPVGPAWPTRIAEGVFMKMLIAINRVCYGLCLLSITSGAFLAVYSIWTEQEDVGWKGVATAAVLTFASILVLTTNSIIGTKMMSKGGEAGGFVPEKAAADPTHLPVDK